MEFETFLTKFSPPYPPLRTREAIGQLHKLLPPTPPPASRLISPRRRLSLAAAPPPRHRLPIDAASGSAGAADAASVGNMPLKELYFLVLMINKVFLEYPWMTTCID